jgi:hypothetical protein
MNIAPWAQLFVHIITNLSNDVSLSVSVKL